MYTTHNFKTKKAFKAAVAQYLLDEQMPVTVFQPGPFGRPSETYQGRVAVEGPHYPQAHTWYAEATVVDGVVVKVV